MTLLTKFYVFVEDLATQQHDLASDTLVVALSNVAPNLTDTVLSDITQIDYTGLTSRQVTVSSATQVLGVFKLVIDNLAVIASNETPFFRYIVLYNDTTATKKLIGYYDYGSSVKLYTSNTLTLVFDAGTGALQIE